MRAFYKKLRAKWTAWTERIPRKKKVLIYILLVLLMVCLIYVFKGAPALSWQHRYRRIEKTHFIGPGQILGHETVSGSICKDAVVARTEEAVVITTYTPDLYNYEQFLYLPTRGRKILVSAAPQVLPLIENDFVEDTLTVFVVDEYPEAVRAELELTLYWLNADEEIVRPEFRLSAERTTEGYFRIDVPIESWGETAPEYQALKLFCSWTRNRERFDIPENACSATVRLYDAGGKLIAEEQQSIFE